MFSSGRLGRDEERPPTLLNPYKDTWLAKLARSSGRGGCAALLLVRWLAAHAGGHRFQVGVSLMYGCENIFANLPRRFLFWFL